MLILIIVLCILCGLFGLAFHITGALVKALVWLFILLPLALCLFATGIVCCCTLLLIPVGMWLFKAGGRLLAV